MTQSVSDWGVWVQLCTTVGLDGSKFWGLDGGQRPFENTSIKENPVLDSPKSADSSQSADRAGNRAGNIVQWSSTPLSPSTGNFESMKEAHVLFLKTGWRMYNQNCRLGKNPKFYTDHWVNEEETIAQDLGDLYRCAVAILWVHA